MKWTAAFLLTLFLAGCNLFNKEEDIPSYIYINDYRFNADEGTEGTDSQKLSDYWVHAGTDVVGVFPKGTTFPILYVGSTRMIIQAGVQENGIAATRIPYPFFEAYYDTVELAAARVDTIVPVFSYKSNTEFPVLEGFESGVTGFEKISRGTVELKAVTDPALVFEGDQSAVGIMTPDSSIMYLQTVDDFTLPVGRAVWVELNYKCDAATAVGLVSESAADLHFETVAGFNPTTEWNKIYINLTNLVASRGEGRRHRLMIYSELPKGMTEARVYLDNIKLLYLE